MTALAWVMLAAGVTLGGPIGYFLGYYFGKRSAAGAVIQASAAIEEKAVDTAVQEKNDILQEAAKEIASIHEKTPEQVMADLEALK